MSIVKQTGQFINDILETTSWLVSRLESKENRFKISNALNQEAEVILPIRAGALGEVTVIIDRSRRSFPAQAVCSEIEFKRGEKVRVVDIGVNTLYVDTPDYITASSKHAEKAENEPTAEN